MTLNLAMKDPAAFVQELREKYHLKLKGDGPIAFHLGAEYSMDKGGTLGQGSDRYIDMMAATYEQSSQKSQRIGLAP